MTSLSPGLPLGRSRRMVNLTARAGSKAVKVTDAVRLDAEQSGHRLRRQQRPTV